MKHPKVRKQRYVDRPEDDEEIFGSSLDERIAASDADIAAGRCRAGTAEEIMKAILEEEDA